MKTKIITTLSRDELRPILHYELIAETTQSSRFNTGRAKRLYKEQFQNEDQDKVQNIINTAQKWYAKGTPEKYETSPMEIELWQQIAQYCAGI